MMKLIEEQIIAINNMIDDAIHYGGDAYGPFLYCDYLDNLIVSLQNCIKALEIENVKVIIKEEIPYLEMIEGE